MKKSGLLLCIFFILILQLVVVDNYYYLYRTDFTIHSEEYQYFISKPSEYSTWGGDLEISSNHVITSLWDSDGDVFFQIDLAADHSRCIIDSGNNLKHNAPLINIMLQDGLQCIVKYRNVVGEEDSIHDFAFDIFLNKTHYYDCKWDGTTCKSIH